MAPVPVTIKVREEISPEQFCLEWFGLHKLPHPERIKEQNSRGYRKRCIELLCEVLGKSFSTVNHWGSGTSFSKFPPEYRSRLAQVLLYKQVKELSSFGRPFRAINTLN
ncbi:MAG: hypothetical protein F6K36_26510 [Symploca sp. SIO3C6]|nr:hypothetical protein [Symploca sp. SIO3C6]